MLKPFECSPGLIEDAETLTLVLSREPYEQTALVFRVADKKIVLFLSGGSDQQFRFMESNGDYDWRGLLIPNVAIELDETSLVAIERHYAPLGSLIRHRDKLLVQTTILNSRFNYSGTQLPIMLGLPAISPTEKACFAKWQIVLGDGEEKRVLFRVDATPAG